MSERPRRLRDSDLRDTIRKIASMATSTTAPSADTHTTPGEPPGDIIDELTDRIYKQVSSRKMPRWSIIRLEWDNMMKYGEGNCIDFSLLRGHMSGIVGSNDAGKSSVLDILTFSLYGESSRTTKHNIERISKRPAERSWTSVWICTYGDNPVMYRVDRGITNGRTAFLRVYARSGDASVPWSLQSWGTIVQTQQQLATIIGDVELFKNIALSAPGDVNICNCNYADRLRLFAHMLGVAGLSAELSVDEDLHKRLDVLNGTLAGMQRYTTSIDDNMGMTANEIEWLEERFANVDSGAVAAELRERLTSVAPRDTILVHSEYEEAAGLLRETIRDAAGRANGFKWNPGCPECSHNRLLCGVPPDIHDTIESLSADRDRLAAEYDGCRKYDYMQLELAYAEKHVVWSTMKKMAVRDRDIQGIRAEIAAIEQKIRINELINGIINGGMIAKLLCDWYVAGIVDTANLILGYMKCEFSLAAELTAGGLKLVAVAGHTRVPVELGGGFQRFACDLAIRAAISRHNGGPDVLIIDEGFDCMDAVNRFRCIDTFPVLVRIFKVLIVISHLENITGGILVEHQLIVQVLAGVSRLRNTARQLSIPEKTGRK